MKKILFTIVAITLLQLSATAEEGIEERLRSMNALVANRTDNAVVKRVETLLKAKRSSEVLIGRSATFFPLFDEYLKKYNLPAELKYITVLETELINKDVSYSGATGIWQLMADVKEEFGLKITKTHDERYDLCRATEAALKDLKRMYAAYDNWELTLAGYNCGVGRLGAAIKKARSRDFNVVQNFLPEQTRNYIPKFIAYTYLMKFYHEHGLKPRLPELDLQTISPVKVYQYLSLSTVAAITGVAAKTIEYLNPQFGDGYVPATEKGCNLILPTRVMSAVVEYLSHSDGQPSTTLNFSPMVIDDNLPKLDDDPNYFRTTYEVADGESLESLADIFNCSVYNIQLWNNLEFPAVGRGQELIIYMPRVIPKRV